MHEFKVRKDGFAEIRKGALKRSIPMAVLAILAGLSIPLLNATDGGESFFSTLHIVVPVTFGAVVFGLYRGLRRQQGIFDTYTLRVDDNGITREQANTPVIHLNKEEIKLIQRAPQGAYVVRGASAHNVIIIPAQIDDPDRLKEALARLAPIKEPGQPSLLTKLLFPFLLLVITSMVAAYTATNKVVVGVSGLFLLSTLTSALVAIHRSKNVDRKTKRGSYWLVHVLVTLVIVIILKLKE
jgi:hypothetical protein